jgi:hypothetical protein
MMAYALIAAIRSMKNTQRILWPMKGRQFTSVDSWERKASGHWTGGQSSALNPGSKSASTKRRQKTSHARGKKVSRPRVRKQNNPDKEYK